MTRQEELEDELHQIENEIDSIEIDIESIGHKLFDLEYDRDAMVRELNAVQADLDILDNDGA